MAKEGSPPSTTNCSALTDRGSPVLPLTPVDALTREGSFETLKPLTADVLDNELEGVAARALPRANTDWVARPSMVRSPVTRVDMP